MKITRSKLLMIIKEELDSMMPNDDLDQKRADSAQRVADHYGIDFQLPGFIGSLMAEEDENMGTAHIDDGAIYQGELASIISRKWNMDELRGTSEYIFDDPGEELAMYAHSEILLDHPFFDAYYDKENQEFTPAPFSPLQTADDVMNAEAEEDGDSYWGVDDSKDVMAADIGEEELIKNTSYDQIMRSLK
tara:strand:+ start:872 stop:1441 length:570 start_codon:yes stop_codon:yes gene_type:complete